jgi:hypothetical protein
MLLQIIKPNGADYLVNRSECMILYGAMYLSILTDMTLNTLTFGYSFPHDIYSVPKSMDIPNIISGVAG